ncbi:MAG: hypothetical protein QM658_13655 [Gordonia sp. (in: high G+C Gram-positive bacteria)]
MDIVQRGRELNEWWQLRRRNPAALMREQQRQDIARRAEAENQAWLAGQTGAEYGQYRPNTMSVPTVTSTRDLPNPRGPQPIEIGVAAAAIIAFLIFISILPSPAPKTRPTQAAAVSVTPTTSTKTKGSMKVPTEYREPAKPDLPAVPVGQTQTLEGTNDTTGDYKAKVTVTAVTRTSDTNVVVTAKIDVVDGELPLGYAAWNLMTRGKKSITASSNSDNGFGDTITGTAEGQIEAFVDAGTALAEVRLQPPSDHYRTAEGTNETAVWTIGTVTTSLTETPAPTAPAGTGTDNDVDLPNVNVPNPNLPGDCVNGRRKSNGHFC